MEVDDALLVGLHDILREQNAIRDIPADLPRHVIPLGAVHHRVFIGVLLLCLLIIALNEGQDLIVRGVGLAHQGTGISIGDILLRHLISAVGHNLLFHKILDLLHGGRTAKIGTLLFHRIRNALDLRRGHAQVFPHHLIGFGDGCYDFGNIKSNFRAVSLDDFHFSLLLLWNETVGSRLHNTVNGPYPTTTSSACQRTRKRYLVNASNPAKGLICPGFPTKPDRGKMRSSPGPSCIFVQSYKSIVTRRRTASGRSVPVRPGRDGSRPRTAAPPRVGCH